MSKQLDSVALLLMLILGLLADGLMDAFGEKGFVLVSIIILGVAEALRIQAEVIRKNYITD